MITTYKIRLKKGDTVVVRSGKHTGKTGKVLAVYPKSNKVTVDGINVVKRHYKPTKANPRGGIVEITKPIWVSKVGIIDSTSKKPSRVVYKTDEAGTKKRMVKSSMKEIK